MCYSTLVMEDDKYGEVPGVDYYSIETSMGTFRFAQQPAGVVPSLLEDLAKFRKQARAEMAEAKARGDDWTAALANGRQLAFKVLQGFLPSLTSENATATLTSLDCPCCRSP